MGRLMMIDKRQLLAGAVGLSLPPLANSSGKRANERARVTLQLFFTWSEKNRQERIK